MKMRTVFSLLITFVLASTFNPTIGFAQQAPQVLRLEHQRNLTSFAYSPDSATLATCGEDGKVRLWDTATGENLHTLEHPNVKTVHDVAYSPDGTTVASASDDWKVRLWDTATGTIRHTLIGHNGAVIGVAYSPDGTTLASGLHGGDRQLRIWDAETRMLRHSIPRAAHRRFFNPGEGYIVYSPDGTTLISPDTDRGANLIDVADGTLLYAIPINGIRDVEYSPDGSTFAICSNHGAVQVWDVVSRTRLHTFTDHNNRVTSVAYSPDSRTLISGGRDRAVRVWDVATGTPIDIIPTEEDVSSVTYSPDGTTFAAGDDGHVYVWNAATRTIRHKFHVSVPLRVMYSPDGTTLAAMLRSSWILIYRFAPPSAPIIFTPSEVADQTFSVGTPVNLTLPFASGGTAPYTYTLTPLSNGLQFNPTTRELHGTPLTAMDATTLTYTATDANGRDASLTFNITVTTAPATGITFSPSVIAPRTFVTGSSITPVLLPVATGGTAPYTYTLAPLPDGLAFDATTRQLTGTPTTVGSTSATYAVTDAASTTASLTFTINVIDGSTPGDVPDAALAAAIRRSLGLPAGTGLTTALINQLTNLDGYAQGITTLTGLEQATNLRTLDLGQNQIVDISTLAGLTQLTHLYLDDNQITDVSALSGLRNLRLLRLAGNSIQDTSPLAALVQQNPGLDLDIPVTLPPPPTGVTVTDAKLETVIRTTLRLNPSEPITTSAMLNLTTLEAYNRRISSLSGLEHAVNLIALDLGKNEIVDISPLAGLTQLEVLYLDDNQIVDVSPLAGLTNLDTLFLDGNPIASLAPISHLIDDIRVFRSRAAQ